MTEPEETVDLAAQVRAAVRKARHAIGDPRTAVNIRFLRSLSGASPAEILAVLGELDALVPVEEEMRRRHVAGGRGNYAQIGAPFELYALVRLLHPQHVVETGVSSGVSSAHLLLALEKNHAGTLHSIDFPTPQKGPVLGKDESPVSIPPGLSSGWAIPFRSPRWDLRIGEAQKLLPELVAQLPSVELFLHDDLHTEEHLTEELTCLRPKLPPGAVVLADNTNWTGDAFPKFAKELRGKVYRRGTSHLLGFRIPPPRSRSRPPVRAPTSG
ncbi:MAG: O-methyltransferase [Thermoplasmata archaeon]